MGSGRSESPAAAAAAGLAFPRGKLPVAVLLLILAVVLPLRGSTDATPTRDSVSRSRARRLHAHPLAARVRRAPGEPGRARPLADVAGPARALRRARARAARGDHHRTRSA